VVSIQAVSCGTDALTASDGKAVRVVTVHKKSTFAAMMQQQGSSKEQRTRCVRWSLKMVIT